MFMDELSLDELSGTRVDEPVLDYCLRLNQRWQRTELAIIGTSSGQLIASPAVWQGGQLELGNVKQLLRQQGYQRIATAAAAAATIRTLLHDAEGNRASEDDTEFQQLDRTLAQQALADIVTQAVALGASDIHLVFYPTHAALSFRVDGRLLAPVKRSRDSLSAAIAAALNTQSDDFHEVFDERRLSSASILLPIQAEDGLEHIRLRTQKSPTRDGFAVTLRIQRERTQHLRLDQLGVASHIVASLRLLIENYCGLILVVGTTGQGKTTTLAGINLAIAPDRKVISLEEPIEIVQPYIEQKSVQHDHPELNFAAMIKVALREDPDVISISEIRDRETAAATLTATLTGHLVTATIHAYDCLGALQRLADLGVSLSALAQPGLLAAVIAQRLVAQPCPLCQGVVSEECSTCHGSGRKGRRLVVEYLPMSATLRAGLLSGDLIDCRAKLVDQGWLPLTEQLSRADGSESSLC